MALRNIKISSEILQNCKKYISGKPLSQFSTTTNLKNEEDDERLSLLRINFGNNPNKISSEDVKFLQPALLPDIAEPVPYWNLQEFDPFPVPIREYNRNVFSNNDGHILKSSIKISTPTNDYKLMPKKISTTPRRNYSQRKRVDPNKGHECEERKKKCSMHDCPRFHLDNCKQTKGSDCRHFYQSPNCKKQFAPYPSYSESCAERLPEDPSECLRCPWTKCRDVENIRPQKRKLHTRVNQPGGVPFRIPPGVVMKLDGDKVGECNKKVRETPWILPAVPVDAKLHSFCRFQDPCKRPPGVCEERERKTKKEKCDPPKKKYNPCKKMGMSSRWKAAYGFVKAKEDPLENDWVDFEEKAGGLFATEKRNGSKSGCKNRRPSDRDSVDQERQGSDKNRESKNRGGRNDGCRKCLPSSGAGQVMLASRNKNITEKCPEKKKEECPKRRIRPIPVDKSINHKYKPKNRCCDEEKKGRRDIIPKPKVFVPDRRT